MLKNLCGFLQNILKKNENTYIYKYLETSFYEKDKFYLEIKKYYNKNKQTIFKELLNACKGINNLPILKYNKEIKPKVVRIPVFASDILSNPHGFDKKTLCGKLFILLLCNINNLAYPKNSEELAELYYKNGLLVDDVSSIVLCKNILGYAYGDIHKGLQGFYNYNEPIFLTLYNLANIDEITQNSKYKEVLITENPAVFMEVVEKCKIKDFPMICTYGQVKLAGIVLMDLLEKHGYKLYYSGDIDPEGIQIADRLKQKYGKCLELIGFDGDTYLKNISNIEISDKRIKKLNSIKSKELENVCEFVKNNKKASYEEKNINYIISFVEKLIKNT